MRYNKRKTYFCRQNAKNGRGNFCRAILALRKEPPTTTTHVKPKTK